MTPNQLRLVNSPGDTQIFVITGGHGAHLWQCFNNQFWKTNSKTTLKRKIVVTQYLLSLLNKSIKKWDGLGNTYKDSLLLASSPSSQASSIEKLLFKLLNYCWVVYWPLKFYNTMYCCIKAVRLHRQNSHLKTLLPSSSLHKENNSTGNDCNFMLFSQDDK